MTERLPKGANSQDIQLMHLEDVNAAPTIADGDALVFDETTEKFMPSSGKTLNIDKLNIASLPTSADGLSSGDIWANSNVLTVVP